MQESAAPPVLEDLTEPVRRAQRGFRSDVAALIEAATSGGLYVALAKPLADVTQEQTDAPSGTSDDEVSSELGEELTVAPHILSDSDGRDTAVAFTDKDILRTVADHMDWTTDGEALEIVGLPAKVVFDLSLGLVQQHGAQGLVLNPGDESELFLDGRELASIAGRQPLPLVGYVQQIPVSDEEATLVAEPESPPPEEFVQAIERWAAAQSEVVGHSLKTTFNPERDIEPHLTLTLHVTAWPEKPEALTRPLLEQLMHKLPPPGYIDVLLDTEPPS